MQLLLKHKSAFLPTAAATYLPISEHAFFFSWFGNFFSSSHLKTCSPLPFSPFPFSLTLIPPSTYCYYTHTSLSSSLRTVSNLLLLCLYLFSISYQAGQPNPILPTLPPPSLTNIWTLYLSIQLPENLLQFAAAMPEFVSISYQAGQPTPSSLPFLLPL